MTAKPAAQSSNKRILVVTPNFIIECVSSPNRPEHLLRLVKKLALEELSALQIFNSKDNSGYFLKLAFKSGGAAEYKLPNAKECAEVIKSKMKSFGHPAKAAEPPAQRTAPAASSISSASNNSQNSQSNHNSHNNNNNGMTADMFAHRIDAMTRLFNERPSLEAIQRIMEILREATDSCPDQENSKLRDVVKQAQLFLARDDVQRLLEEKKKMMPEPPKVAAKPAPLPNQNSNISNVNTGNVVSNNPSSTIFGSLNVFGSNSQSTISQKTPSVVEPPPVPVSINASSFFSDMDEEEDDFKQSDNSFEDIRISSPVQPVAPPALQTAPSVPVVSKPIISEPLFESAAPTKKNVKSLFDEDDDNVPVVANNSTSAISGNENKTDAVETTTIDNSKPPVSATLLKSSSLSDDMDSFFGELNTIASTNVTPLKSAHPTASATPASTGKDLDNITSEFNELFKSFGVSDISPAGKSTEFSIDDIEKIMGGHSFLDD